MSGLNQKTVKKPISFSGLGLHSGKLVKACVKPADPDNGIVFKRIDLKNNNIVIPNFINVSNTSLNTTIENEFGVTVSTIEHLMAAFYICGIDNLIVNIDGPEVPIMDGSAKDFVEKINITGSKTLGAKRKFINIGYFKCEKLSEKY